VSGATGWLDPLVLGGLAASAAAFAAFAWLQLRGSSPLVDLRLFADRAFAAANLVSLLTGYTLATAVIGGPVFINRVLFGTDADAATALTALTLAIAGGALLGGLVSGFVGERVVTVAGVALTIAGLWLAMGWDVNADREQLVRDLAIFGVGFGLTVAPRATAAVEAAGAGAYGVASAMLQVTRTVGMSVGLALLTSIGQSRIDELSALVADPVRRDALLAELGETTFIGVDPNASLALVAILEEWSRGEAAGVLRLVFGIALGVALVTLVPAWFVRGRETPAARTTPPDPRR
jgi:hypothetical protein